jgi:hypothetical protein
VDLWGGKIDTLKGGFMNKIFFAVIFAVCFLVFNLAHAQIETESFLNVNNTLWAVDAVPGVAIAFANGSIYVCEYAGEFYACFRFSEANYRPYALVTKFNCSSDMIEDPTNIEGFLISIIGKGMATLYSEYTGHSYKSNMTKVLDNISLEPMVY